MLLDLSSHFNRLRAALRRRAACSSVPLEPACPLKQPDAVLPAWVATDPIVAHYGVWKRFVM
jgi:hypothetical protein